MKTHVKNVHLSASNMRTMYFALCILMTSFLTTSTFAYANDQYNLLHSIEGPQGIFIFQGFSPDGQRLLTTANAVASIWDVRTGKELVSIDMPMDYTHYPVFSPDGRSLVAPSQNNTAKVWDATTGQELMTLKGHGEGVVDAQYLPDGNILFTRDNDGVAKTWDAKTGKEIATMTAWWPTIFSRDGKYILTGNPAGKPTGKKSVHMLDARTGKEVVMFDGHAFEVTSMDFSPDGRHIVTGSKDQTAKIWDIKTGELFHILGGHSDFVQTVAYSANGLCIYSTSWVNTPLTWNAETGDILEDTGICDDAANPQSTTDAKMLDELAAQGGLKFIQSWAFSPDGQYLVIGSNSKVDIWKVQ